jgi:tight adherence protein C
MIGVLTLLVFVLAAAAGPLLAGWRAWSWRAQAMARLSPAAVQAPAPASTALLWRELVGRIGAVLPASPKDLPRLKRRLLRAGFRHPAAAAYLQGLRLAACPTFGLCGLVFSLHSGASLDRLLMGTAAAALFGYMAPNQYLSWRIARRQHAVRRGLPNALDLMVISVESGLGIDQTVIQVARELHDAHPEISDEFALMNLEMRAGKPRAEALHNLAERTGVEDVKKLVAVLVQTDRFGTSVAQSLRGHADYLRALARQRAEERAAKLAIKLVFPIFFCILPSLFVVTVGPVLTRLIRDLLPMIENM